MESAVLPLLFAHRGGKTDAPENTLAAFRWVSENRIAAVELDVHRCATGELVVIHDFRTRRICGADYKVEETPFAVLRSLDAGSSFDKRFAGEKIPLLEEVFDYSVLRFSTISKLRRRTFSETPNWLTK